MRQVWKAYDDTNVALAKQRAATALLAASDPAWAATLESYQRGLATFPDVREAETEPGERRGPSARRRVPLLTRAAAFALSTGDLARWSEPRRLRRVPHANQRVRSVPNSRSPAVAV